MGTCRAIQKLKTQKADEEDATSENNKSIRSPTLEPGIIDFVALPKVLDRAIESYDPNAAIGFGKITF